MKFPGFVAIAILFTLLLPAADAQEAFRIKADFSIKSKSDSSQSLTMGTVYYDKNIRKVIYQIRFPEPETWVQRDSMLFKVERGIVVDTTMLPFMAEVLIFHLALNGNLPDYGLKGTPYEIEKVEKEGDLVIKTYMPPEKYRKHVGKVMISNQNRRLHGIIFFDAEDKVMSKQFFEEYQTVKGVAFPSRVVQIATTLKGKELYQVTTYRNIVINGLGEDNLYNFPLRFR